MMKSLVLTSISLGLSLTGCGVADTGAAAAAAATTKAEEIRQGHRTEQQVRDQVEAATKQAAGQRDAAEAAAQ